MKPDQERVKNLLTDTVTLLCKNGLTFSKELRVEGLLGITTDSNDVFFIHISDAFGENGERLVEKAETDSIAEKTADKRGLKDRGGESPQSIRNVNKSQGSSRPTTPNTPSTTHSQSPAPQVKIKQEKHDDVILIEAKTEGLSSCSRQRHYSDTAQGNGNLDYSGLNMSGDSAQGSFDQYDSMDGEPPKKRRTMGSETGDDSHSGGGDSFGAYITGIVRNVHEKDPSQQHGNEWTPPAVNLGAEIAAQMAQAAMAQGDNSLAGLENMPGCSSWSPGQNLGTSSSQPSDMSWKPFVGEEAVVGRGHLHRTLTPKPYKCSFPACGRGFTLKWNLKAHIRDMHSNAGAHACPVEGCGRSFKHLATLCQHKRRVHGIGKQMYSMAGVTGHQEEYE